jgi:hypothetical protein
LLSAVEGVAVRSGTALTVVAVLAVVGGSAVLTGSGRSVQSAAAMPICTTKTVDLPAGHPAWAGHSAADGTIVEISCTTPDPTTPGAATMSFAFEFVAHR